MKWILFALFGLSWLAVQCHAQQSPRDVPESARREILRRGNMVQMTGTIQADGGLMAAAFAPPGDDSHKWFITLVGKPGESGFEAMRQMIASNKEEELLAWIDAAHAAHSTTHYQVRSIDDPTQKDWLAGLKPAIDKYGLPVVVLQPPRTGQFGPPATIVKAIHGRHPAKELSELLRDGVITYVKRLEQQTLQAGIRQDDRASSVPPPFNVAPQPPVNQQPLQPAQPNNLPVDWPPSDPKPLTMEQIKVACPGATPEFLISTLSAADTNLDLVKLKWLIHQKDHPDTPDTEIVPANPQVSPVSRNEGQGLTALLPWLVIGLIVTQCLVMGWLTMSGRKSGVDLADLAAIVRSQAETFNQQSQASIDPIDPATTSTKSTGTGKRSGSNGRGSARNG